MQTCHCMNRRFLSGLWHSIVSPQIAWVCVFSRWTSVSFFSSRLNFHVCFTLPSAPFATSAHTLRRLVYQWQGHVIPTAPIIAPRLQQPPCNVMSLRGQRQDHSLFAFTVRTDLSFHKWDTARIYCVRLVVSYVISAIKKKEIVAWENTYIYVSAGSLELKKRFSLNALVAFCRQGGRVFTRHQGEIYWSSEEVTIPGRISVCNLSLVGSAWMSSPLTTSAIV